MDLSLIRSQLHALEQKSISQVSLIDIDNLINELSGLSLDAFFDRHENPAQYHEVERIERALRDLRMRARNARSEEDRLEREREEFIRFSRDDGFER